MHNCYSHVYAGQFQAHKTGSSTWLKQSNKALIKSHISRDDGHFYSVAMQVAAHEAKQGHGRLAEELTLLDKAKATG
jgi:hypothetical protein